MSDAEAFTVEGIAGARATAEGLAELERTTPTLAPYRGVGVGLAFGEDGIEEPFMAVALEHADAVAATDNVERLEQIVRDGESLASAQPWSDVFEIDSIDADGTTVVARLAIDLPALWPRVVFERDSLLVHD